MRSVAGDDRALVCRVGGRLCAIPLQNVVETMRPLPAAPVADAPPFVLGLALIRGAPMPVVDLGSLLSGQLTSPGRLVTIRLGDQRRVALAVDQVIGVRPIPSRALEPLPPLVNAAAGEVVDAVGALDAELLLVLRETLLIPDQALGTAASP